MRIDEILTESARLNELNFMSSLKKVGAGVQAAYNAAKSGANKVSTMASNYSTDRAAKKASDEGAKQTAGDAKAMLMAWSKYASSLQNPTKDDVDEWLSKRWFNVSDTIDFSGLPLTDAANTKELMQYFTKVKQMYDTGKLQAVAPAPSSSGNTGNQQQTPTVGTSIAGATLTHVNPDVITYKKRNYVIGDKGQWIDALDRKQTPVNQTLGALFDKIAGSGTAP